MRRRRFLTLDVCASAPGRGNPLAVILDAEDLDTAAMQSIAAWLNLSETTFVLAPTLVDNGLAWWCVELADEDAVRGLRPDLPAIAALLHAKNALPSSAFLSSQGREMGRDGAVEITVDGDGEVWIGGQTQTVVEGELRW